MAIEKVEDLLKDEGFMKTVLAAKSVDEVLEICKNNGIELADDAKEKIEQFMKSQKSGELSDDDLEDVAGGFDVALMSKKFSEWINSLLKK